VVYFFLQNLLFKTFVDFAFGKLHSASSSTRVIFVAKATHVLNDKFCWKKLHRVFSDIFVLERGKCHNVHLATLVFVHVLAHGLQVSIVYPVIDC
jgi:hypothetical protein